MKPEHVCPKLPRVLPKLADLDIIGEICNATRLSERSVNQLANACISHQKKLISEHNGASGQPSQAFLPLKSKLTSTGIHEQSGQKRDACWTPSKMSADLEVKPRVSQHCISPNHRDH